MKKRNGIAAVCLLCALAISALATQDASAALTGTTAVTCKSTPATGFFSDAHCTTKVGGGNFSHESIESGKTTELSVTNGSTCEETKAACPLKLKALISGVTLEITTKKVVGNGSIHNVLVGEEHQVVGSAALTFEEASVTAPAGKGCEVEGEKFSTNELALTSAGQGMVLQIAPVSGELVSEVRVKGCSVVALNNLYALNGNFKGTFSGATVKFTHSGTTESNTLTLSGQKTGIDGQLTLSARANSSEAYTPLAATTTGEATKEEEEEERFRATEYPATLSGNQAVQHSFAAGTKEIECTEATFPGTLSSPATALTITPEYKSCRTELNLLTTATMNGCKYVLHESGKTSISCPAGKKIQFHVFESEKKHLANEALCTYSIPPQGPIGEVIYEPEGSGSTADLLIKYKVTGITYEVEGPKLQCGSSASNGEYTGSSTETAKNEKGEQIGLFIE